MLWSLEDRKWPGALGVFPDLWSSAKAQLSHGTRSRGISEPTKSVSVRSSLGCSRWSLLEILLFRYYCIIVGDWTDVSCSKKKLFCSPGNRSCQSMAVLLSKGTHTEHTHWLVTPACMNCLGIIPSMANWGHWLSFREYHRLLSVP